MAFDVVEEELWWIHMTKKPIEFPQKQKQKLEQALLLGKKISKWPVSTRKGIQPHGKEENRN